MSDPLAGTAPAQLAHGLDLVAITPNDVAVLDPMPRALRVDAVFLRNEDATFGDGDFTVPDPLTAEHRSFATVRVTPAAAPSNDIGDSVVLRFWLPPSAQGAIFVEPIRIRKVWATDTTDNVTIHGFV
jgi:hypothetical protein